VVGIQVFTRTADTIVRPPKCLVFEVSSASAKCLRINLSRVKDYVYRKYMKGVPIQVSAGERGRYITIFNAYIRYGSWGTFGGTIVLCIAMVTYSVATATSLSDTALYVGLGSITVTFMGGYYWAWNMPAPRPEGDKHRRNPLGQALQRGGGRHGNLPRLMIRSACG
jgi:hypothetical protein